MDDSNAPPSIEALDEVRAQQVKLDRVLARRLLTMAADDGSVTVTYNGHGALVGLEIDATAAQHPDLLGSRVTSIVDRAARAGRGLSRKVMARHLPGFPTLDDLWQELRSAMDTLDYRLIDHGGPAENKNRIARHNETMKRLYDAVERFKRRTVSEEIDEGIGRVTVSVGGGLLEVHVVAEVVSRAGLLNTEAGRQRISRQITAAINRAHLRAMQVRIAYLEKIKERDRVLG